MKLKIGWLIESVTVVTGGRRANGVSVRTNKVSVGAFTPL